MLQKFVEQIFRKCNVRQKNDVVNAHLNNVILDAVYKIHNWHGINAHPVRHDGIKEFTLDGIETSRDH